MKLIINIDEETYKKCKWKNNGVVGLEWWERAIANGTPLPKGHGRLIDADALLRKHLNSDYDCRLTRGCIDSEPTIIEADKEQTNETDN